MVTSDERIAFSLRCMRDDFHENVYTETVYKFLTALTDVSDMPTSNLLQVH